ncbi:T9SS type A sorting domain-containing protein [bacterium]|nr:T9SS type A sorting domain-containing protein [bacterium]
MYTNCNEINGLAIEGDSVWWATTEGIVRWNRQGGTYEQYTALDYQTTFELNAVAIDTEGMKWFGGGMREHLADNDFRKIVSFDGITWRLHDISSGIINSIALDQNGIKWFASVGGSDGGVERLDGTTWTTFSEFKWNSGNDVAVDGKNIKWVASDKGLWSYNDTTWVRYTTENSGLPSDKIRSLAFDEKNGILWMGLSQGVASFDGREFTTCAEEDGPVSEVAKVIAVDPSGVPWFGTYHGLWSFDGTKWTTFTTDNSGLPDNLIRTVLAEEDGSLLISVGDSYQHGTPKYGLTRFDGDTWNTIKLPGIRGNDIYALAVDRDNVKWISTWNDAGLSRFDGSTWTTYTEKDGMLSSYFSAIAVDHDNVKWFGSWKGVCSFDGTSWKSYTADDGPGEIQVNVIAVDLDNVKWFGTNDGVSSFDGTSWKTYDVTEGFVSGIISSAAVDLDNVKWFGTPLDGVLSFDGTTWKHYTEADGLVNDSVNTIAVDHDNVKWFGTGWWGDKSGISRFDGTRWTTYTEEDGLCWNVINAIAVDDSNVKWFCSLYSTTVSTFDGSVWSGFDPGVEVGGYNTFVIDHDGIKWLGTKYNGLFSFDGQPEKPTAVDSPVITPSTIEITGIYPNPFNNRTTLEFTLHAGEFVRLDVYNLLGQIVKELAAESMPAGNHRIAWDGKDRSGNDLSSGIYFFRLRAGNHEDTGEALLVR